MTGPCGIHITATRPCAHCARAKAAIDMDLAGTKAVARADGRRKNRMTDSDVARIRQDLAAGITMARIARETGFSESSIRDIRIGWSHRKSVAETQREQATPKYVETAAERKHRKALHAHLGKAL